MRRSSCSQVCTVSGCGHRRRNGVCNSACNNAACLGKVSATLNKKLHCSTMDFHVQRCLHIKLHQQRPQTVRGSSRNTAGRQLSTQPECNPAPVGSYQGNTHRCHPKYDLQRNRNATPRQALPQADQDQSDDCGTTTTRPILQLQQQPARNCRPEKSPQRNLQRTSNHNLPANADQRDHPKTASATSSSSSNASRKATWNATTTCRQNGIQKGTPYQNHS